MPTRNVNLTKKELDHFVLAKVESGRYENASEVVRERCGFWSAKKTSTRRSWPRCGRPSTKATPAGSPRATHLLASGRSSSFP